MEKVRPWCDQPSDQGRLENRTEITKQSHGWEMNTQAKVAKSNVLNIAEPSQPVRDSK